LPLSGPWSAGSLTSFRRRGIGGSRSFADALEIGVADQSASYEGSSDDFRGACRIVALKASKVLDQSLVSRIQFGRASGEQIPRSQTACDHYREDGHDDKRNITHAFTSSQCTAFMPRVPAASLSGGGTCVVTEPPRASGIASPSCGGRAAERGGNRERAA